MVGKAKRFNPYDEINRNNREITQAYGTERQKLSVGSSFRNMPLSPPTATNLAAGSSSGTGDGTFCSASISADQTTNISATDHIEFDTLDEDGGITLQTGAGQADGIFELGAGKKYYLSGKLRPEFSGATGQLVVAWYDITNTAEIGSRAIYEAQTHASNNANQPAAECIITPTANITIELRIISVTALTALANEYCNANLFEISLGAASGAGGGGGGTVSFPITPDINDHGNVGTTTEDLDLSASTSHIHKITLTGDPTLTFSNPPSSGTQIEFEIEFVQDATGNRTVTWPASVAETVNISSAADSTTIITVRTNDGGTTYHAIPALRGSVSLSGGSNFANTSLSNLSSPTLNTDLDFGSYDINNLDRLEFISDSAAVSAASVATIYLDANDHMVFNVADQKQWFWTNGNETIMQLDRDGVNNDTVLTLETDSGDADAIPRIDIFRDDPSPANDTEMGQIRFIADESGGGANVYGQIAMEYENVTAGREAASMIFTCSYDTGAATSFTPFLALNTENSGTIDCIRDLNLNGQDMRMDTDPSSSLSKLIFDGWDDADTFISNNASDNDRIDFDANGVNTFAITYDTGSSKGQVGIPSGSNAYFSMLDHFMIWSQITAPADALVGNSQGNLFLDNSTDPPILKLKKKDSLGSVSTVSLESAGATTELDNLGTTAINADLLFDAATYDIGDSTNSVQNVFLQVARFYSGTGIANIPNIYSSTGSILDLNFPTGSSMVLRENGSSKYTWTGSTFTAPNTIITATQTFNDNSTDASANGMLSRNGTNLTLYIPEFSLLRESSTATDNAELELKKIDAAPQNSDNIGEVTFVIEDTGVDTEYAAIQGLVGSLGTQDAGAIVLRVRANSAMNTALSLYGDDNNAQFVWSMKDETRILPTTGNLGVFVKADSGAADFTSNIGTSGTLVIPFINDGSPSKTDLNQALGAFDGAIGVDVADGKLYVRNSSGAWNYYSRSGTVT